LILDNSRGVIFFFVPGFSSTKLESYLKPGGFAFPAGKFRHNVPEAKTMPQKTSWTGQALQSSRTLNSWL